MMPVPEKGEKHKAQLKLRFMLIVQAMRERQSAKA
jgi:hypothetical protein